MTMPPGDALVLLRTLREAALRADIYWNPENHPESPAQPMDLIEEMCLAKKVQDAVLEACDAGLFPGLDPDPEVNQLSFSEIQVMAEDEIGHVLGVGSYFGIRLPE